MTNENEPNVLVYDLETGYNAMLGFDLSGPRGSEIPYKNILTERYIISATWKWLGQPKVYGCHIAQDKARFKKDPHDDRYVLEKLAHAINQSDAIIAHYGDKFDWPYVLARTSYHNMPPLRPPLNIDTWKLAHNLRLNCYRLDYLAQYYKLPRKKKSEWEWWIGAYHGSQADVKRIYSYNQQDSITLEKVFLRLRRYLPRQINMRLFGPEHELRCGHCGHKAIFRGNYYPKGAVRRYKRVQCTDYANCGAWDHMSITQARKYGYKGD